jgi:hypothetical protein
MSTELPPGWDIPQLDIDMQALKITTPVITWGTIGRNRPMPGTYGFYTDDYRFTCLWKQPDLLVATGCAAAVELNYSTWDWSDPDEVLVGVYRKRVLARYWQTKGIRILVDLNVAPNYQETFGLLGVPEGWRSYATRSHRIGQMDDLEEEHEIACRHAGTRDILFAVFGGSKKVAAACKERGYLHIPEHIEVVRGRAEPFASDFELTP